jgi:predicted HicB family RNase H-like nuclease
MINDKRRLVMATRLGGAQAAGGGVGKNLIHYKGYIGKIEFDEESRIFHGEVINLHDVVTFEGESVAELQQAFQDSIEDYLEFCAERGEKPEKPFSGKFILRIDPELHRLLVVEAKKSDVSLNQWITQRLEEAVA